MAILKEWQNKSHVPWLTQIEVNGAPKQADLEALNQLGKEMAQKLRESKGE